MFKEIYNYVQTNFDLNEETKNALLDFFDSLERTNSKLKDTMIKIGNKYSFETVKKLKTTPHISTNTLFFWRDSFQFPISIALDEEELDSDFRLIVKEDDISSPLLGFIDGDLEDVCFDIYHAWVAFHFQNAKLYESGIPMGITVNSDIVSYYFNDFSYDNFSDYHQVYETDQRMTRPFHRDLSMEEIFIRTHLVRFPYTTIELFSQNEESVEQMKMENSIMQITTSELSTRKLLSITENQFEKGNRYERKVNTDIDELIKYFESTVNKGYEFQLSKCSIVK